MCAWFGVRFACCESVRLNRCCALLAANVCGCAVLLRLLFACVCAHAYARPESKEHREARCALLRQGLASDGNKKGWLKTYRSAVRTAVTAVLIVLLQK